MVGIQCLANLSPSQDGPLDHAAAKTGPDRHNATVLVLTSVVLVLGWHHWIVLPLKLLVVLFHELGHATMALLTGGQVVEIAVGLNQGGHTLTRGGSRFLILNGGYLGSLAVGLGLLVAVRRPRAGPLAAGLLGVVTWITALLWVPLFSFAFLFCGLMGAGFLALTRVRDARYSLWGVRTVGLFSVLYALLDIRDDVFGAPAGAVTDATMLADATGIPALLWGAGWGLAGLVLLWRMRRSLI